MPRERHVSRSWSVRTRCTSKRRRICWYVARALLAREEREPCDGPSCLSIYLSIDGCLQQVQKKSRRQSQMHISSLEENLEGISQREMRLRTLCRELEQKNDELEQRDRYRDAF